MFQITELPDHVLAELVRKSPYLNKVQLVERPAREHHAKYVLVFAVEVGDSRDGVENVADAIEEAMEFASSSDWQNRCWQGLRVVDGQIEVFELTYEQAEQAVCARCGTDLRAHETFKCAACMPVLEEAAR